MSAQFVVLVGAVFTLPKATGTSWFWPLLALAIIVQTGALYLGWQALQQRRKNL